MLDRFNREINYLRISVTDRCNLSCEYCKPEKGCILLPEEELVSFAEVVELAETAATIGFVKLRLTGGEPLMRSGIVSLVQQLAHIKGYRDFGLTTNGILLPQHAVALRKAGLHRLNISIDTLDARRFREIARSGDLEKVLAGIESALAAGFNRTKLNCVISASPDEEDARQVSAFGLKHGLEVRFIRRMDLDAGKFWPVIGGEGGHCDTCSRIRVSCDGKVYPCLFGNDYYSIRELGIRPALELAVGNKPEAGRRSDSKFYAIGG